jgi:hypothetical protein
MLHGDVGGLGHGDIAPYGRRGNDELWLEYGKPEDYIRGGPGGTI